MSPEMAYSNTSSDIDELDDLEQQLLLLKEEEARLCQQPLEIPQEFGAPSVEKKIMQSSSDLVGLRSTITPIASYSTVDPLKGDVRGYKRARLIRRIGAVIALGLAVVAAVTVASTGELENTSSELLDSVMLEQTGTAADDIVPEALENAGSSLTDGQKLLFKSRYQDLLNIERRHKELDDRLAAHLVHRIEATSEQNNEVDEFERSARCTI
jgi:hypothetical protein